LVALIKSFEFDERLGRVAILATRRHRARRGVSVKLNYINLQSLLTCHHTLCLIDGSTTSKGAIMTASAMPAQQHLSGYRPDIDGLRAVAVIAVVIYHGWPNFFPGGFIGVDIFFVISGYLITSIIVSDLKRDRFSILGFYSRRIRRIFPALVLMLAATIGFGWFVLLPAEFKQLGTHVAAGGAFVSNLQLWHETGYFDNAAITKPLLHLWSLGIEEQFYVLWPLLLWLVYKRRLNVFLLIGVVFVLSMGVNLAAIGTDATQAFYSPATRFWELMTGGIGAQLTLHHKSWPEHWKRLASIAGALLLVASFVLIRPQDAFPGWWALLPVTGAFLLIMAGPSVLFNRLVLATKPAVGIGLISYPLYLWHWPLLSYAYIVYGDKPSFIVRVGLIAAAFVLAFLTYRLIELPVRTFANRARAVGALASGMAVAVLAGLLVHAGAIRERIDARGAELFLNALNDSDFPGRTFVPYRYKGVLFQKVNSRGPGLTVFLGDSVVQQYGPYIEQAIASDPDRYHTVVFATAGNCPPIQHTFPLPKMRYALCPPTVDAGYEYASRPDVDTVVIGGAWYGYFNGSGRDLLFDDGKVQLEFPDERAKDSAYRSLEHSLAQLKKHGKRVFLLLQPPMGSSFDPRNMVEGSRFDRIRPLARIEPVSLERFLKDNADARERLIRVARATGVELIDPTDFLCADNHCPVLDTDGTPVYTDTMHMRPRYSRSAAGYLSRTIASDQVVAVSAAAPGGGTR
jgi:peptidoglycan/LPS O-acetylase OafA/YrhL